MPGCSTVPLPVFVISFTFRSSMTTTPWVLAMVVVALAPRPSCDGRIWQPGHSAFCLLAVARTLLPAGHRPLCVRQARAVDGSGARQVDDHAVGENDRLGSGTLATTY